MPKNDAPLTLRRTLAAVLVLAAGVPAASRAQAPPSASLSARLDGIVERAHAAGAFDGVVLVGRGDSVMYARAVGAADRSWSILNTPETRFPWASVTKQVTATVVLQLVGEGRLALDTPLSEVLPDLRAGHAGRVRVRHLLANSSGLPDPDTIEGFYVAPDSSLAALVDAALRADLAFEPGSTFRYNNLDFILLGRVIEALTGTPLAEAFRARVFEPAGMLETVLLDDTRIEPRLATAAVALGDGRFGPPPAVRLAAFGASGALAGPIGDLFRFDRALLGGRLLSPALRDSMFAADPALGFVALSVWTYGFGVGGRTARLVERQGWIGGYRALNVLAPDDDAVLVVLSNTDAADLSRTYTGAGFSADLVREVLAAPGRTAGKAHGGRPGG